MYAPICHIPSDYTKIIGSVLEQGDVIRRFDGENEWFGRLVWPCHIVRVERGKRAQHRLGFRLCPHNRNNQLLETINTARLNEPFRASTSTDNVPAVLAQLRPTRISKQVTLEEGRKSGVGMSDRDARPFQLAMVDSVYSALWTKSAVPLGWPIPKWTILIEVFVVLRGPLAFLQDERLAPGVSTGPLGICTSILPIANVNLRL